MSPNTSPVIDPRRYRRRILGWGAAALVLLFVVGSVIFLRWVQRDLADRSVERLNEAGIGGVTVSFSGQDGTLSCAAPLDDPDGAAALIEDLWGVRTVDIDRSCIERAGGAGDDGGDGDGADDDGDGAAADTSTTSTTTTTEAPPTTEAPIPATVVDALAGDPQYSTLVSVVQAAGLDTVLAGDGPFTVFAPNNDAFGAIDPELLDAITSDPELLTAILTQHVAPGSLLAADLVSGDLEMVGGATTAIDVGDDVTITSLDADGTATTATVTQPDVVAANGVVHGIDTVLLPPSFDPTPAAVGRTVAVTLDAAGNLVLTGTVASEEERQALVDAAIASVGADRVIDELVVDASLIGDADAEAAAAEQLAGFAALVAAMPPNMVSGEATLDGDGVRLSGVFIDADAEAALQAAGAAVGAELDLTIRPEADAESAAALEDELNEFVALNPVTFEPNSFQLTPEAEGVLDQVAGLARQLAGVSILVEGHTDSDGTPQNNLVLSENRAAAVVDALVARGLDPATLSSDGFGSERPVLDDTGAENKAASRRVEFVVSVG